MNKKRYFYAIVFAMLFNVFSVKHIYAAIPSDAYYNNGHYYKKYELDKTWPQAKAYCEALGGHLMTITSDSEQEVLKQLGCRSGYNYWLGGTDAEREGVWKWCTGEPWIYSAWRKGQPDNYQAEKGVAENYLQFRVDWGYAWNDSAPKQDYSASIGFVCEWEDKTDISKASVTLSKTSYVYDGQTKTPSVTVTLNGKTLQKGTDYAVTYKNNINSGKATVTITGKGNYKNTKAVSFEIQKGNIAGSQITLSKNSYICDNIAKTPSVTVTLNGKTLKKGTDYTVAYKNNTNPGTATVTVTGKGNYKNSVSVKFQIKLNAVSQNDPVRNTDGLKLSWSAVKGATGYEIYCKTGRGSYQLYNKTTSKSYTMTPGEIQCDVDYAFKVRAYRTSSATTSYGAYSSEKKYTEGPFVKIGKKYYYQGKMLKKKKYELELPLVISKNLSVPDNYTISAKDLTAEADIILGKKSVLNISGNAAIKKQLSLSQNAKMTISKNLTISSGGYLAMQTNSAMTVGGSYSVNSSKNSVLKEGIITVTGNVSLKKGFQSIYNNEIILSGKGKHTIEIAEKCTVGILNLLQTDIKTLTMKGNGSIYGSKLQFDYKKGTYDLTNEFSFTNISLQGTIDKDINRTIANSLFVIMALKACDGKDLLSDFYGSMAGTAVYSKKSFAIPIAVQRSKSSKAEYGTLRGNMQGLGELKFGTVFYKSNKGNKKYTVVVSPSIGKTKTEIDRFMNKLTSGARKEIASMIIHDVLISQIASTLSEVAGVFEWSNGKIIATNLEGGLLFKDFRENLERYNSICSKINKKW